MTFFVLGASHAVLLKRGETCILELLTCLPQSFPQHTNLEEEESAVLLKSSAENPTQLCVLVDEVVCRVELTPFSLEQSEFLEGDFEAECQLEFGYPILAGDRTPMTRVGWRANENSLLFETVHTYPEEIKGVRSRTEFRVLGF